MKHIFLIMIMSLGFGLVGCGKADSTQVSADYLELFSSWTSDKMTLDLSKGREGIFDMVVYHIWDNGNPYKCYATVHFYNNVAKVVSYWQDSTPIGFTPISHHCSEILSNKVFDLTQHGDRLSLCDQNKSCRDFSK